MNDTINALIVLDDGVDDSIVEAAVPPGGNVAFAGLVEARP